MKNLNEISIYYGKNDFFLRDFFPNLKVYIF